jgi:DNA-binding CsgD family transcriptional regulator/PAS domain-containing protein
VVLEAFHVGMTPSFLEALRDNSRYWVLQADSLNWKPGKIYYLNDLMSREELKRGKFYREVLKPHRQLDYMGMLALAQGKRMSALSVNADEDAGYFTLRAVELMRLLAPHIERAARISDALDLKSLRADMVQSTLDGLACGVLLLNAQRRVLYANPSAGKLFQGDFGISMSGNAFHIQSPSAEQSFAQAMNNLGNPGAPSGPAIAAEGPGGKIVLTVIPVTGGRRRDVLSDPDSVAAVFIQTFTAAPLVPRDALGQAFGFTPAEIKVVMAMVQGFEPKAITDIMGVEESTIRTHIRSVFSKAGVSRQAELISLLMRVASPVGPDASAASA